MADDILAESPLGVEPDPFADAAVIPELEHLGKAIVDAAGMPSGSPANFEATRGVTGAERTPQDIAAAIAKLKEEFPAP